MTKEEQIQYIKDNYPLYVNDPRAKRALRHTFFSKIETEMQAYMLGFYAADGSINEKRKTFRIHLQWQDADTVNLYRIISPDAYSFIKNEHKTTGRNHMIITAHKSYGIDINSIVICQDLVRWGFGYNKSSKPLHLPDIDKKLLPAFIRGYFDGDGSFVQSVIQPKARPHLQLRTHFFLFAKKIEILQDIMREFALAGINAYINYMIRDDLYRLTVCSKSTCRKIFHYLYDNANFYLLRKYKKFSHFANTEDSQLIAESL